MDDIKLSWGKFSEQVQAFLSKQETALNEREDILDHKLASSKLIDQKTLELDQKTKELNIERELIEKEKIALRTKSQELEEQKKKLEIKSQQLQQLLTT